jgi:uncharacterized UPF0146 family protein
MSSSEQTIIYSSAVLYSLLMRVLYWPHFQDRYRAIAAEIPDGVSVVDVCAGDCYLYKEYLHRKSVDYLALDISPQFVRSARKRGITSREFNLWHDEVPAADIILMHASLYQFLPNAEAIMRKLLAGARRKVIIAEPIRNLSDLRIPLVRTLVRRLTRPRTVGSTYVGGRFDQASLTSFFHSFEAFERVFAIPGGREMVGIFRGEHAS